MAIKLVAIDIDDTLLTDERTVPDRCKQAIQASLAKGVRIVLASGRMYKSALGYARELDISGPMISYNGGLVIDTDGSVYNHEPVPIAQALEVARLAQERGLHLNAYLNDDLYVERITKETELYTELAGVEAHPVGDLVKYMKDEPTKLLFVVDPDIQPALVTELRQRYEGRLEVTSSKKNYVEITKLGISKGKALSVLSTKLGIEQNEVMAIGDGLNDLTMIEYAGIGVAVHNAHEKLRRSADFVTVSNEEGGVAEAIEKFVL